MKKIVYVLFVVIVACNYSINKKVRDPLDTNGGSSKPSSSPALTLSYQTLTETSLKTCADCHHGTESPDLMTYEQVKKRIGRVIREVQNDSMPDPNQGYSPLSPCEKDLLIKWQELGMPEESDFLVSDIPSCQS